MKYVKGATGILMVMLILGSIASCHKSASPAKQVKKYKVYGEVVTTVSPGDTIIEAHRYTYDVTGRLSTVATYTTQIVSAGHAVYHSADSFRYEYDVAEVRLISLSRGYTLQTIALNAQGYMLHDPATQNVRTYNGDGFLIADTIYNAGSLSAVATYNIIDGNTGGYCWTSNDCFLYRYYADKDEVRDFGTYFKGNPGRSLMMSTASAATILYQFDTLQRPIYQQSEPDVYNTYSYE